MFFVGTPPKGKPKSQFANEPTLSMEDIPVYVKVKDLFCIMIHTLCQSALDVFLFGS
jgi:hypothetical protein